MKRSSSVALLREGLTASALAVVGTVGIAATAVAAPQQVAELVLHGIPSHAKWIPEEEPLFGKYLASGDGEVSGAVAGHVVWDLYEDQTRQDRHPTFFLGTRWSPVPVRDHRHIHPGIVRQAAMADIRCHNLR